MGRRVEFLHGPAAVTGDNTAATSLSPLRREDAGDWLIQKSEDLAEADDHYSLVGWGIRRGRRAGCSPPGPVSADPLDFALASYRILLPDRFLFISALGSRPFLRFPDGCR
jgi:hypothetical protein